MLQTGKLDSELLKKIIFNSITFKRDEVITRPGIGEDCAVVDYGDYFCVMSTDPITASVKDIGRLAIHISCNDIASNGVQPLGIMLAVMLPEGTTEEDIHEMMKQAGHAAEMMEVEIIGGHTEITGAVNKPVIVSTAIGRQLKSEAFSEDIKPGDYIMMTKYAGMEGTGIIACDYEEFLSDKVSSDEITEAQSMLDHVSVVKEGVIAGKVGVSAMHDITEGGVLGAVWEMCNVAGAGAVVDVDAIPIKDITKKICAFYDINILRLISSGCMLILVSPENRQQLEKEVKDAGIEINCIGRIQEKEKGIIMKTDGKEEVIAPPESDELYKAVK